jgi:phosphate transport system permease protein
MSDSAAPNRSASPDRGMRSGSATPVPEPEATISTETGPDRGLLRQAGTRHTGDRLFRLLVAGSGAFVVVLIAAVGLFLLLEAIPALQADKANFLFSGVWQVNTRQFGILYLLWVTVATSVLALVIAMPISFGIALFLTQYAPRGLARLFAYIVDLLAAVPSIIFGLWGIQILGPYLVPIAVWLHNNLGFIPLFGTGSVGPTSNGNVFVAGVVLAVMILPTITGVTREVFARTPTEQIEGALALGATKWEVVRTTVVPFGRSGYVSAVLLGLGRALGETVALYLILSGTFAAPQLSLFDGGATIASKIAADYPEFNNPTSAGAYIAAGLVLFLLTFVENAIGRFIARGPGRGTR